MFTHVCLAPSLIFNHWFPKGIYMEITEKSVMSILKDASLHKLLSLFSLSASLILCINNTQVKLRIQIDT